MAGHSINRIRVALAEQNKTNCWLAEHIGKSEITVSRWVQNKAQPSRTIASCCKSSFC